MNRIIIAAIAATLIPTAAMAKPADHHGPSQRHDARVVIVDKQAKPAPAAWHRPTPARQRITVGARVEPSFIARHKTIQQPARYRLARTGPNTRWLKVADDAVLVNLRSGKVLNIAYNLFR